MGTLHAEVRAGIDSLRQAFPAPSFDRLAPKPERVPMRRRRFLEVADAQESLSNVNGRLLRKQKSEVGGPKSERTPFSHSVASREVHAVIPNMVPRPARIPGVV